MAPKEQKFLKLGTIQSLVMAVYHFFIPMQFQWGQYMDPSIPSINWATYTTNFYFSLMLLLISGFLLFLIIKRKHGLSMIILAYILGIFWLVNFIYLLFNPMPLPSRMHWLQGLFAAIALLNLVCFIIPLYKRKYIVTKSH